MAWSKTAPELPSGSAWEQEKSVSGAANHWSITGKLYIARLNGRQFAIKAELTSGNGEYGTYYPPEKWTLRCDIGGVTGTADTSFDVSKGTTTFYFVGEAGEGVNITVTVGGAWKKASKVYVKSSGAWKEGQLKINVGGAWK